MEGSLVAPAPRPAAIAGEVVTQASQLAEDFVISQRSANTARSFAGVLRRFLVDQEIDRVEAITAKEVRAYEYSLRARRVKPATIRQAHMVIRSFLRFAQASGAAIDIEVLSLKPPAAGKERVSAGSRSLSRSEYERLISIASSKVLPPGRSGEEQTPAALRNLLMVLILGDCGLRSDELRGLLPSSDRVVRADNGRRGLEVIGKGSYERTVPLTDRAQETLARWLRYRTTVDVPSPYLFIAFHRGGKRPRLPRGGESGELGPIDSTSLERMVRALGAEAAIPEHLRTVHTLRHTYATLALSAGVSLEVLRKRLGHATIKTTEIYLHDDDDAQFAADERIESAIADAGKWFLAGED